MNNYLSATLMEAINVECGMCQQQLHVSYATIAQYFAQHTYYCY